MNGSMVFSSDRLETPLKTNSKITFADSMLYQSNLFQNTIGLRHYPLMDKKIFQSQSSFRLEFFSKLNWLFYTYYDSNNSVFEFS